MQKDLLHYASETAKTDTCHQTNVFVLLKKKFFFFKKMPEVPPEIRNYLPIYTLKQGVLSLNHVKYSSLRETILKPAQGRHLRFSDFN